MKGIYRGETTLPSSGFQIIKYLAGESQEDAELRAVFYDDPVWRGVPFTFIEPCEEPHGKEHHGSLIFTRRDIPVDLESMQARMIEPPVASTVIDDTVTRMTQEPDVINSQNTESPPES